MIAGHDPRDALSSARPVPDYTAALKDDLRGLKLAVVKEIAWPDGIDAGVRAAFERALGVLKDVGAEIGEVSLPWAKHAIPLQMLTSDADASSMYLDLLKTQHFGRSIAIVDDCTHSLSPRVPRPAAF